MSRMSRGPGGGPKRRIRTRMISIDNTTIMVGRNRSKKPMPANWRELLVEMVRLVSSQPPRRFFPPGTYTVATAIPHPSSHIPRGSLPTSMILFVLDGHGGDSRLQKRVIDWSLARCDVHIWPVPKPSSHNGAGGERFVNTSLYLRDTLVGDIRHSFNPIRLKGVEGVDWRHVTSYIARKGKAEFLGVKTTCGEPCECRRNLPEVWSLGWEMHY